VGYIVFGKICFFVLNWRKIIMSDLGPIPTMAPDTVAPVDIRHIRPNLVALRAPQVESDEFQALMKNIKDLGKILDPVHARVKTDEATGEQYFELIDGLQRYTIAQMLKWETVPMLLKEASDMEVLIQQIALNGSRVTTKPAAFAQQLLRIIDEKPAITTAELAELTGQSESWVNQRLALNKLVPQIGQEFVDTGAITVANAYQLARLPQEDQIDFVESAQSLGGPEFTATINSRLKEIRAARAAGRDPNKAAGVFEPVPTLRKAGEIKNADLTTILDGVEVDSPEKAAKAVLNWVLQMDPLSIKQQQERYELRRRQKAEDQIAKQKERAAKLSEEAAARAEQLKKDLGLA
jgi:ParB/RepB/Spo0J family partition protein